MTPVQDRREILIVDDDEVIRRLLSKILTGHGFKVREASLASQALQLVDNKVGLILIDIMLPDYDGMSLLTRIRRRFPKEAVKACFISSLNESETVTRSLTLGAQDYVIKPVDREILLHKVTQLLGRGDSGFAWVLADLPAELVAGPVLPDLTVVRVSETGLLIKSTARIQVDHHVLVDVPGLATALGGSLAEIPQRVVSCEKGGRGVYFIGTEFTGLPDRIAQGLRAVAIRGRALTTVDAAA